MLLKTLTPLSAATLAVLSLAASGCNSDANNPKLANHDSTFLGFVTVKPDSFAYTQPATLELHSNQVYSRPNVSGTQVTLLDGLFTYVDY